MVRKPSPVSLSDLHKAPSPPSTSQPPDRCRHRADSLPRRSVSEVAPTRIRGALLGLYSLMWGLGGLIAAIVLNVIQTSSTPNDYKRGLYSTFGFAG